MSVAVRLKVAGKILKETFAAPRHTSVIHINGNEVTVNRMDRSHTNGSAPSASGSTPDASGSGGSAPAASA